MTARRSTAACPQQQQHSSLPALATLRDPRIAPFVEAAAQQKHCSGNISWPSLRHPPINAGADMSDTKRKVSRRRFSAFEWTSTIPKPGSIMAMQTVVVLRRATCYYVYVWGTQGELRANRRVWGRLKRNCAFVVVLNKPTAPENGTHHTAAVCFCVCNSLGLCHFCYFHFPLN